ncbi:MAG: hypothetical protein IKT12_02145, partial [Thermoguttaceae bacterium]|nr:hypothetical protein [Thermoguttaceae bacterium]
FDIPRNIESTPQGWFLWMDFPSTKLRPLSGCAGSVKYFSSPVHLPNQLSRRITIGKKPLKKPFRAIKGPKG